MTIPFSIQDGVAGVNPQQVDANNQAAVKITAAAITNPSSARIFSENDAGSILGVVNARIASPETEGDYRLRVAEDTLFDVETFNYTAQNTAKHTLLNTTMTMTFSASGALLNGGAITTTTTGVSFGPYKYAPFIPGAGLYAESDLSFSAQPTANMIVDFGMFLRGGANPYAPTDGAYFRLNSAGVFGVINNNGTETTTAVFSFAYTNNTVYRFVIAAYVGKTQFWINDVLYGEIATPIGQAQPFMAAALPWSIRQAIVGGAAGSALQATVRGYNTWVDGGVFNDTLGTVGNRVFGSYEGLSGGTMGSLANYANSANPAAAVPTNTTAALGTGLGGQFWETDTLAVNTDGIICSYQVPAGTVNSAGKRLRLTGVKIDSYVQAALTGGGYNAQWALCFGHTAVSLATGEASATKAPRRVSVGSNSVVSAAAALAQLSTVQLTLTNPIYVNPGEFIALARKKVGTAPSAGTIAHTITLDYSWE